MGGGSRHPHNRTSTAGDGGPLGGSPVYRGPIHDQGCYLGVGMAGQVGTYNLVGGRLPEVTNSYWSSATPSRTSAEKLREQGKKERGEGRLVGTYPFPSVYANLAEVFSEREHDVLPH